MSTTPVIFDDGSKAMVAADKLSAALKDGGKVATPMQFDDGSKAYVTLDRVHDAIHDGGSLIGNSTPAGAPPQKGALPGASNQSETYALGGQPVKPIAESVGSVIGQGIESVPNTVAIAHRFLQKHGVVPQGDLYQGEPSLEKMPENATLMMAGEDMEAPALEISPKTLESPAAIPRNAPSGAPSGMNPLDLASMLPGHIGMAARILKKFGVGKETPVPEPLPSEFSQLQKSPDFGTPQELRGIRIPQEPTAVYPGAPNPSVPPPELLKAQVLARGGSTPPAEPAAALANIPVRTLNELPASSVHKALQELGSKASISSLTERANNIAKLEGLLNDSLGGKPLQPNVPLRQQMPASSPNLEAQPGIPAGHVPVESSALKSYKYDPETKEFESVTQGGQHYVHGDVSPEVAAEFEKAGSKGKAWQDVRKNGTLVAKIINGKRVPVVKSLSDMDQIPNDEWQAGHDLGTEVEGSKR